jgi:hypothetical protein
VPFEFSYKRAQVDASVAVTTITVEDGERRRTERSVTLGRL